MRTFFGILLGALLTLGGAYVYDSVNAGTRGADGVIERPMVNWDVVSRNAGQWTSRVQATISQLINSKPSSSPAQPPAPPSPAQTDTMEPPRPNAN